MADDLGRVESVNCTVNSTPVWGQNFTFDAFGNMTKTTPPGQTGTTWQPVYSQINNRFSLSGANVTYEADGDLTNDSYHSYTWDAQGHPDLLTEN